MNPHGDRQAFSANLVVYRAARVVVHLAGLTALTFPALTAQAQQAPKALRTTSTQSVPSSQSAPSETPLAPAPVAPASPAYRDDTPAADAALSRQDWAQAIDALDSRIAANPRDVQARFKRATALARLGRDDEAIAAFTQITQTYPELPEPYNNLAALYAKHGRYQEARATLETALAANPNFALARRNLGDVYMRLAADNYRRAAQLDPDDRLATARAHALQAVLADAPANSVALAARRAHPVPAPQHTKAEAVNARGFVPSMGSQPPIILPNNTDTPSAD